MVTRKGDKPKHTQTPFLVWFWMSPKWSTCVNGIWDTTLTSPHEFVWKWSTPKSVWKSICSSFFPQNSQTHCRYTGIYRVYPILKADPQQVPPLPFHQATALGVVVISVPGSMATGAGAVTGRLWSWLFWFLPQDSPMAENVAKIFVKMSTVPWDSHENLHKWRILRIFTPNVLPFVQGQNDEKPWSPPLSDSDKPTDSKAGKHWAFKMIME